MTVDRSAQGKKARRVAPKRELAEWKWWEAQGFRVEGRFKRARYIGAGKFVLAPHDLFARPKDGQAGWDFFAVYHSRPIALAGIQVTEQPFAASDGSADRNAGHGPPPFDWLAPNLEVEEWVGEVQTGTPDLLVPMHVQIIVSYANPRAPERRWWFRKE